MVNKQFDVKPTSPKQSPIYTMKQKVCNNIKDKH